MASTTFSGPVTSTAGFVGALSGATTIAGTAATITTINGTTGNITTVNATNIDAGASGTAGTVDVFPSTASKGKTQFTAADNTGNTTTTITTALQASARTYTVPDAGGNASFVMTAGAQTVAGAKTFSTMPIIPTATVAAAGNDQTNAAAVTTGFTLVSAADAAKGVILPAAAAGLQVIIKNGANAVLKIYPNTSDGINALTVTTGSLDIAALSSVYLVAYDATTWYSLPLLAS